MELADNRLIETMLMEHRTRAPRRRPLAAPPQFRPASRHRRCSCGRCAPCLDNLKWTRIFDEKFADPDYYTRSHVPQGSSMNW